MYFGASNDHEEFDNRDQEKLTLRSDLVFFQKPDQIGLRIDLPIIWNNKPNTENRTGSVQSGLGDLLFQEIYAHTFNDRWAAGIGTRWMFPTATGDAFGDGKWQVAPIGGFRCLVPEISKGTFAEMLLRWDNSFGGNPKRSNLQYLIIQPQFDINLPHGWFVNSAPEVRSDYKTGKWFVPLDIMLGRKLGRHWVASIEYRYGLVRGVDSYKKLNRGQDWLLFLGQGLSCARSTATCSRIIIWACPAKPPTPSKATRSRPIKRKARAEWK